MTVAGPYDNYMRYICLSTDTKPTDTRVGTIAYETDTGEEYIYTGSAWIRTGGDINGN